MDLKIHNTGIKFENFNFVDESGNINLTQTELDQMYDEWQRSFDQQECHHDWIEYVGFTDQFRYCVKCDEKKL